MSLQIPEDLLLYHVTPDVPNLQKHELHIEAGQMNVGHVLARAKVSLILPRMALTYWASSDILDYRSGVVVLFEKGIFWGDYDF